MKKIAAIFFGFLFLIMEISAQNGKNPDAYSPQMLKAFADSLYSDGFFEEAESEYKRYLFVSDKNSDSFDNEAVILSLENIYFVQKNKTGINWLYSNFFSSCDFETKEKIDFIRGSFLFNERRSDAFGLFYNSLLLQVPVLENLKMNYKYLYSISNEVLQKNIEAAKSTALKASSENSDFSGIYSACQSYKLKSAGGALAMSVFVPGSGKWYTGNFWTGFSDLLGIAGFGSAAFYCGKKNGIKDWRMWTYASAATILYVVDLYGSYSGAKRYNQAQYNNLCSQVDELYERLY